MPNLESVLLSRRDLIRWSGLALALSGILQALGTVLHPDDTGATLYFQNARWAPAHVGLALSFLLVIYGLMGLYLLQRDKIGLPGAIGFVLSVGGAALLVGVTLTEAFLLPILAASGPPMPLASWLDPTGPLAGAVVVSFVALLFYNVGFIVLGVVTARAGVLPRWSGRLLAIATILSNGEFFGPIGFAIYVVGGVLLGVALTSLGIALFGARGEGCDGGSPLVS